MVYRMEQLVHEPSQSTQPHFNLSGDIADILCGRKNRDRGRGDYKVRDKNDISKQPPKKKKPN